MRTLVLYNGHETYTNTLFEHLVALSKLDPSNRVAFCHCGPATANVRHLDRFDAVIVHYSVRLPYDGVRHIAPALASFQGLKVLFIQDEYEHTLRAWHWIKTIGFDLVFTVVPEDHIQDVYPPAEFPGVTFVSNLTGYVPDLVEHLDFPGPPSRRSLTIGYRGRPLSLRYGALGIDKVAIGQMVKSYCDANGIPSDIAWDENDRIYGDQWYTFMASCRAMLGTESGSNVFDWDGDLDARIAACRLANPDWSDSQVYAEVVEPHERPGVMNQLSPKVFEAIAMRSVLVLFEGTYSGVIRPWEHFIPLAKDGSNLKDVFAHLADDAFVDAMSQRAFDDIIGSGAYSYTQFVKVVERTMKAQARRLRKPLRGTRKVQRLIKDNRQLTALPLREAPTETFLDVVRGTASVSVVLRQVPLQLWILTPAPVRDRIREPLKRLLTAFRRPRA